MNSKIARHRFWIGCCLFAAGSLGLIAAIPTPSPAQEGVLEAPPGLGDPDLGAAGASVDEDGIEVLTRGPIHEAFAEPVERDPAPGLIVPKEPPATIKETPPEVKPEGENIVWISGYPAWDDDREDYIWVSGVWRAAPPGQRWTPGYWDRAEGGWQWVAGFWSPIEAEEMAFLPDPPASVEAGPTSPAPSDTHFWTPGNWVYDTGYTWQPGYWSAYRPDWVWVNARYVWTPAGCLFVPGFWDYALAFRGTMFAPIYYTRPIYLQPNYFYTPWCAIPTNNLFMHMWVRPNYCHYYFGDYYGYNRRGWTPWFNTGFNSGYYCPLLSYYRCSYRRQGIDFVGRLRGWNGYFGSNVALRPPRTWRAQQVFERQHIGQNHLDRIAIGRPLNQLVRSTDLKRDFVKLASADRVAFAQRSDHFREVTALRQSTESRLKKDLLASGVTGRAGAGAIGAADRARGGRELSIGDRAIGDRSVELSRELPRGALKLPKSEVDLAGANVKGAQALLEDAARRRRGGSGNLGAEASAGVGNRGADAARAAGRLGAATREGASSPGGSTTPFSGRRPGSDATGAPEGTPRVGTPESVQDLQDRIGERRRQGGRTGSLGAGAGGAVGGEAEIGAGGRTLDPRTPRSRLGAGLPGGATTGEATGGAAGLDRGASGARGAPRIDLPSRGTPSGSPFSGRTLGGASGGTPSGVGGASGDAPSLRRGSSGSPFGSRGLPSGAGIGGSSAGRAGIGGDGIGRAGIGDGSIPRGLDAGASGSGIGGGLPSRGSSTTPRSQPTPRSYSLPPSSSGGSSFVPRSGLGSSSGIGSSRIGSSGIGSSGIGSSGIGSSGIGSSGIGSSGIGSRGVGSSGIGSRGLGSSGLGSGRTNSSGIGSRSGSSGIGSGRIGSGAFGSGAFGSGASSSRSRGSAIGSGSGIGRGSPFSPRSSGSSGIGRGATRSFNPPSSISPRSSGRSSPSGARGFGGSRDSGRSRGRGGRN